MVVGSTTGILTLSIHEALNFEDELLLSFSQISTPGTINNNNIKAGDLVEIKVWDPKSALSPTNASTNSNNNGIVNSNTNNMSKNINMNTTQLSVNPSASSLQHQHHNPIPSTIPVTTSVAPSYVSLIPSSTSSTPTSTQFSNNASPSLFSPNLKSEQRFTPATVPSAGPSSASPRNNSSSIKIATPPKNLPPTTALVGQARSVSFDFDFDENTQQQKLQQQQQQQPIKSQQHSMMDFISSTNNLRLSFTMIVTDKCLSALKNTGRNQISLLRQVAELYGLKAFDLVTVTIIGHYDSNTDDSISTHQQHNQNSGTISTTTPPSVVDFVTINIKDQFISRGEMHQFQHSIKGKWIYSGQRITTMDGMRGNVMEIRDAEKEMKSGFLTLNTKITFRSRSARIIWLVQISSEMWDYASPYEAGSSSSKPSSSSENHRGCDLYFDKFVSFTYKLFEKWKELEATHSLTVVFFSRTYINSSLPSAGSRETLLSKDRAITRDVDGRLYEDHFRIIIQNETKSDWDSLVTQIKKAFLEYPAEVKWESTPQFSRYPSTSAQGNVLEAINTTLNMLQLHFMDRDLYRTGNSIVVMTAGSGVFEVDKDLAIITKQRMMDNGIGSDMLSLGLPPLHVAPFFLYKESAERKDDVLNMNGSIDDDSWKTYFEIPHWMHLSFVSYDRLGRTIKPQAKVIVDEVNPTFQLANGFIRILDNSNTSNANDSHKQRDLISGRDFDDILEACRPRNRNESTVGLPSSLKAQLKIINRYKGEVESTLQQSSISIQTSPQSTNGSNALTKAASSTNLRYFKSQIGHRPRSLGYTDIQDTPVQLKRTHQQSLQSRSPEKFRSERMKHSYRNSSRQSNYISRRKCWLNPFRQKDEDEVLSQRNHNSRRWSHVFPKGEIEFKRHAGPNWKSLCQPAILPVTIDVIPTLKELNDPKNYSFTLYKCTLEENTHYNSPSELLIELVRQRLIQDFQVVPDEKQNIVENVKIIGPNPNINASIQHTLSMGHRIHILRYDGTDIEVVIYTATSTSNQMVKTHIYNYMLWSPATKSYAPTRQKFNQFPEVYPWNSMDNLICGDPDKMLSDTSRYRRISFRVIPDRFQNEIGEREYEAKFNKLLDYIEKLAQKPLGVKIVTSANRGLDISNEPRRLRRGSVLTDDLKRFFVPLRKGKNDKYEWSELMVSSTFDTQKTFRIQVSWLVASAIRVENQLQLLQRRCAMFGLRLIRAPVVSVSSNLWMNPFIRPEAIPVKDHEKAKLIESSLLSQFDFVDDGKHIVDPNDVSGCCGFIVIKGERGITRKIHSQQYIHHSGAIFIRLIHDASGMTLFLFFENRIHTATDRNLLRIARGVFHDVKQYIDGLGSTTT